MGRTRGHHSVFRATRRRPKRTQTSHRVGLLTERAPLTMPALGTPRGAALLGAALLVVVGVATAASPNPTRVQDKEAVDAVRAATPEDIDAMIEDDLLRRLLEAYREDEGDALNPHGPAIATHGKHMKGTANLARAYGYEVEEHVVHTADGYILRMFRLPRRGAPAVFLQHGLLSSSADFLVLGKGRALAFLLHDAGYDVWLGNNRGTTECRAHESLSPSKAAFWDFSWHEIGDGDLPVEIDHVLAATNQTALHYVGHSQGTTSFFVLGSQRPEYMAKIKTYSALAPVAFMRDVRSVPLRLMARMQKTLAFLLKLVGMNEFLPSNKFISWLGDVMCADGDLTQPACSSIIFMIVGADSQQMNTTMLPQMLANTPAGAATKQLLHYGQLISQKELVFRQYDHGWLKNKIKYGTFSPPSYDLSRVTAKTYLFFADNDLLAVQSNVEKLASELPNIATNGLRRVALSQFNHLDFIFGENAKELVYDDLIATIDQYENAADAGKR